jgi:hypothetical protein
MLQEQRRAFPFHTASVVGSLPASNEFNKGAFAVIGHCPVQERRGGRFSIEWPAGTFAQELAVHLGVTIFRRGSLSTCIGGPGTASRREVDDQWWRETRDANCATCHSGSSGIDSSGTCINGLAGRF